LHSVDKETSVTDDDHRHDMHHGFLAGATERIGAAHKHHEEKHDEAELAEAEEEAGFDLAVDIGHPHLQPGTESFDIDGDIGFGNEPEQPRS
jgi:hypothetical protein